MIGLPQTPALGQEFFNKRMIRNSRRMVVVAAKNDAVTIWKCTITIAYQRLRALISGAGLFSFRV